MIGRSEKGEWTIGLSEALTRTINLIDNICHGFICHGFAPLGNFGGGAFLCPLHMGRTQLSVKRFGTMNGKLLLEGDL